MWITASRHTGFHDIADLVSFLSEMWWRKAPLPASMLTNLPASFHNFLSIILVWLPALIYPWRVLITYGSSIWCQLLRGEGSCTSPSWLSFGIICAVCHLRYSESRPRLALISACEQVFSPMMMYMTGTGETTGEREEEIQIFPHNKERIIFLMSVFKIFVIIAADIFKNPSVFPGVCLIQKNWKTVLAVCRFWSTPLTCEGDLSPWNAEGMYACSWWITNR